MLLSQIDFISGWKKECTISSMLDKRLINNTVQSIRCNSYFRDKGRKLSTPKRIGFQQSKENCNKSYSSCNFLM